MEDYNGNIREDIKLLTRSELIRRIESPDTPIKVTFLIFERIFYLIIF